MKKGLLPITGFAIHGHHDILVQYCYGYQERVNYIKRHKPQNERKTRLRIFKILPDEALKEISGLKKADAKLRKAYDEGKQAGAERQKEYAKWQKADAEWKKAYAKFHKKWCNCEFWNGSKLVF